MPNLDDRGGERNDEPGFGFTRLRLGEQLGLEKLGASLYELPPGQTLWPYHWHHANEELAIVLEGTVVLRDADGDRTLERGELVGFPTGPRGAHQLRNDSSETARILMLSTAIFPELVDYPDSGKLGVFGTAPLHDAGGATRAWIPLDARVDYYDGERPSA